MFIKLPRQLVRRIQMIKKKKKENPQTERKAALSCVDHQQVTRLKTSKRCVPRFTVRTARIRARTKTKHQTEREVF